MKAGGWLWVVGVGGDDGELRPWNYIYEGRTGRGPTVQVVVAPCQSPGGGRQKSIAPARQEFSKVSADTCYGPQATPPSSSLAWQ